MEPWLRGHLPLATLFGAVAATVYFGGVGPAVLTTVLGYVAANVLFGSPHDALPLGWIGAIRASAYLVSCAIIIATMESGLRRARGRARAVSGRLEDVLANMRRLAAIVESSEDAIVSTSLNGVIHTWNRAAERLYGYSPAEAVGRHIGLLIPPDRAAEEEELLARLRRGERTDHYLTVRLAKGGRRINLVLSVSPVRDESGALVGVAKIARDMDRAKFAEQAVRDSEARLRSVVETAVDAIIVIDDQGRIDSYNPAAEKLFGHRASEVIGKNISLLMPAPYSLEHDQYISNFLRTGVKKIIGIGREVIGLRKDGTTFPMELAVSEMIIGGKRMFTGIVRDISGRKRAEDALRASEERLRSIIDGALDAVVTIDADGRVTGWNAQAAALFGWAHDEIIGHTLASTIIPPAYREAHEKGLRQFLITGEGPVLNRRIEITALRRDGSEFPVELAITPTAVNNTYHFSAFIRDISERRRSEKERQALLDAERDARIEAERAARLRDEFLATVSHELRTPLNGMLGWAQLLQRGRPTEDTLREGLQAIERNVRTQARLVEDLLDVSRIIAGKVRLDVQDVNLASVIEAAIDTILPTAQSKNIQVSRVVDPTAGPVRGDPARLQQVVWNLLSNAVKFTPGRGRVSVSLARVNSHVELSVSDTGQGIKPEFLPLVFDRFRQADSSTTRHHGGLGLGLAIVKHIVELHGGTVSAKSAGEGSGATFLVELPLASVRTAEHRAPPRTADDEVKLTGVRVMVVEDDVDSGQVLRRLLEDHEAVVSVANSAREALATLLDSNPHVLVSDIGMPDMDGYDLIREVRRRNAKLPAVAVTAFARAEDRIRSLQAGYDMHIAKPIEPGELLAVVASLAQRVA